MAKMAKMALKGNLVIRETPENEELRALKGQRALEDWMVFQGSLV